MKSRLLAAASACVLTLAACGAPAPPAPPHHATTTPPPTVSQSAMGSAAPAGWGKPAPLSYTLAPSSTHRA